MKTGKTGPPRASVAGRADSETCGVPALTSGERTAHFLRRPETRPGSSWGASTHPADAVTVVVATYDRPDVLSLTLRSLVSQTHSDWQALVIGDHCDGRTGEAVSAIGDPRIRYFNLPVRCGDQSGPNSIGAALCDTPYLVFLNHDDLLLPDHFALCLQDLRHGNADVCVGRWTRVYRKPGTGESEEMHFESSPDTLPPLVNTVMAPDAHRYEPVSAWVMRTDAYRSVGEWHDGADLYRTPLNDWILRAWRARVRFVMSEKISVLNMQTHNAQEPVGAVYQASPMFHRRMMDVMETRSPEAFRAWLTERCSDRTYREALSMRWGSVVNAPRSKRPLKAAIFAARPLYRLARPLLRWTAGHIFLRWGWDAYEPYCRALARRRGWWKDEAIRVRTGDAPLPRVDRGPLLAAAREALDGSR